MSWRVLGLGALVLWVISMGVIVALFVQGHTRPGTDGRTEIVLAPAERDMVLAEMRHLLKAVHGVVTALGSADQNFKAAEGAARAAGMQMAADVNPTIMLKLPLAFKQMGMSIHKDMDHLADGIAQGESSVQILTRLSSMTARCTTCHDMYRFATK
ncbi:MAG: hypothetical protein HY348_09000 [Nitrospira defluvii]|nr:hypothetical protein [Nitrospira defluvii]